MEQDNVDIDQLVKDIERMLGKSQDEHQFNPYEAPILENAKNIVNSSRNTLGAEDEPHIAIHPLWSLVNSDINYYAMWVMERYLINRTCNDSKKISIEGIEVEDIEVINLFRTILREWRTQNNSQEFSLVVKNALGSARNKIRADMRGADFMRRTLPHGDLGAQRALMCDRDTALSAFITGEEFALIGLVVAKNEDVLVAAVENARAAMVHWLKLSIKYRKSNGGAVTITRDGEEVYVNAYGMIEHLKNAYDCDYE